MASFHELFDADIKRYGEAGPSLYDKKLLKYLRKYQSATNKLIRYYYRQKYYRHSLKNGIEIPCNTKIGKGFMICHSF